MTPLFSALLGACVGSVINVCLTRRKIGGNNVVFSSFSCSHCKKIFPWYDIIPVLSFLFLKGLCRYCHKSISFQYPLVEGISAILFSFSSIVFQNHFILQVYSCIFISSLVLLGASDIKWRLLPHPFNNFLILSGFAFSCRTYFHPGNPLFLASSRFFIVGSVTFLFIQFFPLWLGGGRR